MIGRIRRHRMTSLEGRRRQFDHGRIRSRNVSIIQPFAACPGVGPFLRAIADLHSAIPGISRLRRWLIANVLIAYVLRVGTAVADSWTWLGDRRPAHFGQGVTHELGSDRR